MAPSPGDGAPSGRDRRGEASGITAAHSISVAQVLGIVTFLSFATTQQYILYYLAVVDGLMLAKAVFDIWAFRF